MRKLNGSNVITGFQPILCSHYAACAQEMDQNPIEKNAEMLKILKLNVSINIEDFKTNQKVLLTTYYCLSHGAI